MKIDNGTGGSRETSTGGPRSRPGRSAVDERGRESIHFFAELKRRNVYKVAVAYAVVGWLLVQVATQVFPFFEIPNWAVRLVVLAIVIGFPVALVIAWAFELTPEGLKHTEDVDVSDKRVSKRRTWIYVTLIGAALSFALFFVGRLSAPSSSASPAFLPEKSIAVLPFENQNRDPDTDYLCDGIPESIINSLSELPKLKVMSRNSVFHYKGKEADAQTVGKELKVQTLLTGRVRQRGDSLTIGVELINAQDNSQLWGQQYSRKLADVFAVQEEIAKEVSDKLRLKLTGTEKEQLAKRPTENLKAFQYYMQGRTAAQRRTNADLLASVSYYEKALQEDARYALAYAGLSDAYANLGYYGSIAPVEGRRKAEEAARKALELDDKLAEAHTALGQIYIAFAPSDFSTGDRELKHAIELNPNLAVARYNLGLSFIRQGRLDEASAELAKARGLDPISSIIARAVVIPHYFKRDYPRAFELLRQANELGPPLSATWEIGLYIKNGSLDEAFAEIEKAKAARKDDPLIVYSTGMAYAAAGKRPEALQKIKELENLAEGTLSTAHWIAKIYATLNDKEQAFSWLDRGLATGALGVFYKDEPIWDPIRDDQRFEELIAKLVVPETAPTQ
jgi:TolB-like protein/Tfp pilus assembly protein PilF